MLNVAYIGFGNSVTNYHLPYVKTRDYIHVKKIFRREEDRVEQAERDRERLYPHITFTTNIRDLLEDATIDLVVVSSPTPTHANYARMLLEHGKNALIEKPFTTSSSEARELFTIAKKNGLVLMANQNRRFDLDFVAFKDVVESGKCGKIVEVESHYDYYRPKPRKFVGYLWGLGVHTIDQIISVFGIPEHVIYDVRSVYYPHEADDYFDLDLFYGDFKVIIKSCYAVKSKYPRFILHGLKGSYIQNNVDIHNSEKNRQEPIRVDFDPVPVDKWGTLTYVNDAGVDILENVPMGYTDYAKLYDGLHDAIRNGKAKPVKDEETIAVLEIIEQALKERV